MECPLSDWRRSLPRLSYTRSLLTLRGAEEVLWESLDRDLNMFMMVHLHQVGDFPCRVLLQKFRGNIEHESVTMKHKLRLATSLQVRQ
jgi:hypothetical protein